MTEDPPDPDEQEPNDGADEDGSPADASPEGSSADTDGMPPGEKETFGMVSRVLGVWDDVLEDMEATAEEYRDEGWQVLEIHPGDVASPDGEEGGRWGLDVLVPDDEFEELEHLIEVEEFAFDESEVYRATGQGLVLLVVAILDHDTEVAVLFPAYYDVNQGRTMIERATGAGEMHTHLRPLDLENVVTFTHDDPSLFMPPEDAGDAGDE
ncbi:MAG: hypothetical protein ACI9YT_001788 [Halobacteriales archaeon]|jgi:hypothetical protein